MIPFLRRFMDPALRLGGLLLILSGWVEARMLRHMMHTHGPATAGITDVLLAAILFFSISLGMTLLILGRHILDRIPVSPRWATHKDR